MILRIALPLLYILLQAAQGINLPGSSQSYAQYRKWFISLNSSLEFEFLTGEERGAGLIIYMDDGGYYDYLEIKLVKGELVATFNFGGGIQVLIGGSDLADRKWHKVTLTVLGRLTSLTVDGITVSKHSPGLDFYLGNFTTNSYLYVGGLPPYYTNKLTELALPSVVFEPRFEGEIRNLVYADSDDGIPSHQKMMAYKEVRQTTQDHCRVNPCLHGGICFSTDQGFQCNCAHTRHHGTICEKESDPDEMSLRGSGYLGLNMARLGTDLPSLVAQQDNISLSFLTEQANGLLFFAGSGSDYLSLYLSNGEIKLDIKIGPGRLKTGVTKHRFNDNKWHTVNIHRRAVKVTLEVDRTHRERWTSPGIYSLISSSHVYVGGVPESFNAVQRQRNGYPDMVMASNYIGCLRNVEFVADNIHLYLVQLGREGNPLIKRNGGIEFTCTSQTTSRTDFQHDIRLISVYQKSSSGAVSFTRPEAFLTVPSFTHPKSNVVSFKMRTNEESGVLLYHPGQEGHFFGVELFGSHLYLHLNLGTGHVKIRISQARVDDGYWHQVDVERWGGRGTVTLDGVTSQFKIPGEPESLRLTGDSLYLAGVPPYLTPHPPQFWSATLQLGFVGCVRDFSINNYAVTLSELTDEQDSGSIVPSCQIASPVCGSQPCHHGGVCREGWNRFTCDCLHTGYTGPTCEREAPGLHLTGHELMRVPTRSQADIEADNIHIRFKTIEPSGVLFTASDDWSLDKLEISLTKGGLVISIRMADYETVMLSGFGLDDHSWHSVLLIRQGRLVTIQIDSNIVRSETLKSSTSILRRSKYTLASGDNSLASYPNFSGLMSQVIVNGEDLIQSERYGLLRNTERSAGFMSTRAGTRRGGSGIYRPLAFPGHAFLGLAQLKAYFDLGIHFRFRSGEPNGLIMFNAGKNGDFLAIELADGHLHFVASMEGKWVDLKDNYPGQLSNNQWHSLAIHRLDLDTVSLTVDEYTAKRESAHLKNASIKLDGILFLGGARPEMFSDLPTGILARTGFSGCLANLELSKQSVDALKTAVVPSSLVTSNCKGDEVDCGEDTCKNHGQCLEFPTLQETCDCQLTSFTGPICTDESVSFEWRRNTGLVKLSIPRVVGGVHHVALGLITPNMDAVLLRIDFVGSNKYLELGIVDGKVVVMFYANNKEVVLRENAMRINDGKYHVVRYTNNGSDTTLWVDDLQVKASNPPLQPPASDARIQVGGKWNKLLGHVERPFMGVMAGLVFNQHRLLDMARDKDKEAEIMGDVKILDSIPFDYRETHEEYFERMQQTESSDSPGLDDDIVVGKCNSRRKGLNPKCYQYNGDGDELITPIYTPPQYPSGWGGPESGGSWSSGGGVVCDDEDCPTWEGSGDANRIETTTQWKYTTYYVYNEFPAPGSDYKDYNDYSDMNNNNNFDYYPATDMPPAAATFPPFPTAQMPTSGKSYVNYDPKYNIYDRSVDGENGGDSGQPEGDAADGNKDSSSSTPTGKVKHNNQRANISGTLLVIGIICVVIIAVILIIVIVLKMKTNDSDRRKENRLETAASAPSVTPPRPALSAAGKPPPVASAGLQGQLLPQLQQPESFNGFAGVKPAGTRTNNNKPVKEWYV